MNLPLGLIKSFVSYLIQTFISTSEKKGTISLKTEHLFEGNCEKMNNQKEWETDIQFVQYNEKAKSNFIWLDVVQWVKVRGGNKKDRWTDDSKTTPLHWAVPVSLLWILCLCKNVWQRVLNKDVEHVPHALLIWHTLSRHTISLHSLILHKCTGCYSDIEGRSLLLFNNSTKLSN